MDELKDVVPCRKCKSKPVLKKDIGLYYLQCNGNCKNKHGNIYVCDRWHPHEFIGTTIKKVVKSWNEANELPLFKNKRRKKLVDL